MNSSVQTLSECRVLLYESTETAPGYGSVAIRLKTLAESFLHPVNLCLLGLRTEFTQYNAVYAVLIVRGNRAIVAYNDGNTWQAKLLMFSRTLPAVLFKKHCVALGLSPRPDQAVPPRMRTEVANNFVLSCPFLRVGDFVVSAFWGHALVTNSSQGMGKFRKLFWSDFVTYPFTSPEN